MTRASVPAHAAADLVEGALDAFRQGVEVCGLRFDRQPSAEAFAHAVRAIVDAHAPLIADLERRQYHPTLTSPWRLGRALGLSLLGAPQVLLTLPGLEQGERRALHAATSRQAQSFTTQPAERTDHV